MKEFQTVEVLERDVTCPLHCQNLFGHNPARVTREMQKYGITGRR
jgi:hypothetical protein